MKPLAVVTALMLLACQGNPPEMTEAEIAQHKAEVIQEIEDRMEGFTRALLSGNVDDQLGFWSSDVLLLEPGVRVGGSDVPPFLRDFFANGAVTLFDQRVLDIFVHDDAVYVLEEYEETYDIEGMEPFTVEMYGFMRWEKEDGVWKMDRVLAGPRDAQPES